MSPWHVSHFVPMSMCRLWSKVRLAFGARIVAATRITVPVGAGACVTRVWHMSQRAGSLAGRGCCGPWQLSHAAPVGKL